MKKSETLKLWRDLPEGLNPLPVMEPIAYKARGSRYGACGIRIDGNPEFIDAVLSRLKPLLAGENLRTRLELARTPVDGATLGKHFANTARHAEVCYIRLHQRGSQEGALHAVLSTNSEAEREALFTATEEYDKAERGTRATPLRQQAGSSRAKMRNRAGGPRRRNASYA